MTDDQLTPEELKNIRKILGYQKAGRIFWGVTVSILVIAQPLLYVIDYVTRAKTGT